LAAACIRSCLAQQLDVPREVLVFDDASEDGTAEYLMKLFPTITVVRLDRNLGLVPVRTLGFTQARHQWIVSIDDDMLLFDEGAVQRALNAARAHDRTGSIAMPYYERYVSSAQQWSDEAVNRSGDISEYHEVRSFRGGSVLLNRPAVLECGCYPEWIYRQGEEKFLSIRLLDRGYHLLTGGPPGSIHLFSPIRNRQAMSWYGVRNTILFDALCIPQPYCLPYLARDVFKLLSYKLSMRNCAERVGAIGWSLFSVLRMARQRQPVSWRTFRKQLSLPRHGPLPLPHGWTPEPLVQRGIVESQEEFDRYLNGEE